MLKSLVIAGAAAIVGLAWGYYSEEHELEPYPTFYMALKEVRELHDELVPDSVPDEYEHFARVRSERRKGRSPEELQRLESLGYVGGVNVVDMAGVTAYDQENAYDGPRLLSLGHQPEAQLIARDGAVLHRWSRSAEDAFAKEELENLGDLEDQMWTADWRRVYLLEDGGLLAIFNMLGVVRLDVDSNLIWAKANGAHHDVVPTGRGTYYILAAVKETVDWFNPEEPIVHDYLVEIDSDGNELMRISVLEALRDSPFSPLLNDLDGEDPLHANSLQVLDGTLSEEIPAFRAGSILTSSRYAHAIFVINPETAAVEWAQSGLTLYQHDPVLLDTGNILLFDNFGDSEGRGWEHWEDGRSRVLEFDPRSLEIAWSYDHSDGRLFTRCCGKAQRLPNGNTFIVETDNGRAFEVTPDRRIVWDYYTPARMEQYIARVVDGTVLRQTPAWLAEKQAGAEDDAP